MEGDAERLIHLYTDEFPEDPALAYRETWNALDRRYGQPAIIAQELSDRLLNFSNIATNDSTKLRGFADQCTAVSLQTKRFPSLGVANFTTTLKAVASRLPSHLRSKWRDRGYEYKRRTGGQFPPFIEFENFLNKPANGPNIGAASTLCQR